MTDTTPTPACPECGTPNRAGARYCVDCGVYMSDPGSGGTTVSLERQANEELERHVRDATAGLYVIERELGRGGMAAVYLATEIQLNRKVAIKVLPPEFTFGEGMIERFQREARTAAGLDHPNIIPIYRVDSAGRLLYFAMKYVEGRTLADIIHDRGALPLPMVVTVLDAVGSALAYAHDRGVIHRDIKPANILIDKQGVVMVSDFGIAKTSQEETITKSGVVIGTPQYMSPEQCVGKKLSVASDQYSLGIVGFEMLSGSVPFDADSAILLLQMHLSEPPPPLEPLRPDAPNELIKCVERTLVKDPEERFSSLHVFTEEVEQIGVTEQYAPHGRAQLRALATGNTISGLKVATPMSGPSQVKKPKKIPLLWGSVVAAVTVAAAAIGVWQLVTPTQDESLSAAATVMAEEPELADDSTAAPFDSAAVQDSIARADSVDAAAATVAAQPAPEAIPPVATRPRQVTLVLEGIPAEAIVLVDQEQIQGSRIALESGPHSIAIMAQGYQGFEGTLTLRAGQTLRYEPDLVEMPQEFGRLRVHSRPAGILFIDGAEIGELPKLDLQIAAGERTVRIEAQGCTPYEVTITVLPNTQENLGTIQLTCGRSR